jgi:deoxycytidine triphosphate deaminase
MKTCGIQPAELDVKVSNYTARRAKVKKVIQSANEKRELKREDTNFSSFISEVPEKNY